MHKLIRPPSPAMVVACLALFMAGTGAGVAVIKAMPRNSVGTAQLKANAVVSSKVKNHSLKTADFASGQIPKGAAGAAGPAGAAGKNGATSVVAYYAVGSASYYYSYATAYCPTGTTPTGGGVDWSGTYNTYNPPTVVQSLPVTNSSGVPTGWFGQVYNPGSGSTYAQAHVYVICASP